MSIKEQLAAPFPREVEKTLQKGSARLTYVPVSEIITRLNDVFGVGYWGYRINSCARDAVDSDFVIAHVTLFIYSQSISDTAQIDGVGGQKINRTRTGEIIALGDDMKGAVSDALKKAAQALGVGLYLARSEEPRRDQPAQAFSSAPDQVITSAQLKTLQNLFKQVYGKEIPIEVSVSGLLKRDVEDLSTLTKAEASRLIASAIEAKREQENG